MKLQRDDRREVIAETSLGSLKGLLEDGVCVWRGIPYAEPLSPQRRFSEPVPVGPWSGVRDALEFSGICPQKSILRWNVAEDCLSLNIWAPETGDAAEGRYAASGESRPVLFFIHGGAFSNGAGSESLYDGSKLAQNGDAVVVTINYRLGILGFADFSDLSDEYCGNCGLRDVLTALAWVHDHIDAFGGDAENITVIGQSAGGTMVSALAVMPRARPYIAKCIIMSGGPTQLHGADDCRRLSRQFLEFAEIDSAETLTSLSISELLKLQKAFVSYAGLGSATFRLSVDGDLIPEYPIPAAEYQTFRKWQNEDAASADFSEKQIPLLIGTTKEEMSFVKIKPLERSINVQRIIDNGVRLETKEFVEALYDEYLHAFGESHGRGMLYTDLLFRISSVWLAESFSRYTPVWMYRFDFETAILRMNRLHAFHSTDLPFVFGTFNSFLVKPMFILERDMEKVQEISRLVQQDFIRFARTGELPWQRCSKGNLFAKRYDTPPSIQECLPRQIKELYDNSTYKIRSYTAGMNPAPGDISESVPEED